MEFPYFVSACCEQRFQTVSPKGLQKSPSFWRVSPHKNDRQKVASDRLTVRPQSMKMMVDRLWQLKN